MLPWALKFLWAPYVERFRLPRVGRNRLRVIVAVGGWLCAAGLVVIGLTGLSPLMPVLVSLILVAFVTSTVDIACDGYAVETLAKEHHGWGNTTQVGGAYLGSAIGAGLFLVLVDRYGWSPQSFSWQASFSSSVCLSPSGLRHEALLRCAIMRHRWSPR
ncbi:MFS family permease [Sinorhizobium fredii]